jgi:predicted nuclease of predicted toxin-antitoxin system
MKFKLDENLPARLTRMLAGAGHDAISVAAQELGGQPDAKVAEVCRREGRVLLTLDAGFADIRAHPPQEHPGIIVFRLRRQDTVHLLSTAQRILPLLSEHPVARTLWVVDDHRVRFRS